METPSNQSRPLSLKEAYLQRRAELDRSLGIATTEDNAPASTTSPVAAATAGTNASDPVNDKQQEMVPSPDGAAPASPALAGPDATVDATPVPLVAQDDIGLDVESLPAVVVEPPLTEDGATAQEVPVADNMVPEGVEHPALPTAGEVSEPEPHGAPDVGISDAPDLGQQLPDTPLEDVTSPVVRPIETVPNEHIITVPLAANVRKTYDEVVVNSQEIIEAFSTAFTTEEFHMPDPALVNKIDRMFQQLWDICDLPNFNDSIPLRNSHEVMRHATNTNSKFSFIYELLLALRGANRGILIVARRDHSIHNIIEAIATEEGFQHTIVGLGGHQVVDGENPRVTIAGPEDDISAALEANETVIAFDHVSRPAVLKQLAKASLRRGTPAPRMLSLVATYSIEHLDLHFPADMDPLDRRNALVVSLVQIRDLLADTGIKAPLPHDLASLFADFILNPSDEFEYSPQAIPDYACDVYSTQPRAANLNATELDEVKSPKGRKRQLSVSEEEGSKRIRFSPLDDASKANDGATKAALESTLAKISELESRMKEKDESEAKFRRLVRDLESELGSVRKTIQILQPRLLDAIKDRKAFELERDKAVEAARHAADRLEQSKHEIETLRATKAELESKLAGVAHSGSNAGTDGAVEPDGGAKEYLEASAKIKALENKISRLNQDMDFIRGEYQNASSKASALGVENAELSERIKELEGIASEARIRTRQINAEKTVQELQRQLSHQQRLTQEREKEIERLRDEIRALRNGRRETRQSSVPRSPRMSVMSPRPGRIPAGAGMAPNGSRGTSPGPVGSWDPASGAGMPFLNPVPGNGRWGHLRD